MTEPKPYLQFYIVKPESDETFKDRFWFCYARDLFGNPIWSIGFGLFCIQRTH